MGYNTHLGDFVNVLVIGGSIHLSDKVGEVRSEVFVQIGPERESEDTGAEDTDEEVNKQEDASHTGVPAGVGHLERQRGGL